ncbi:MAG: bacillithiol biosynthesis cysteine-adding enzyme BshC [Crocinitomicaceae bacterium]|jgi:bacillithiol biosynthesis cysteine-adding enzyme BshC|nr:bacillithiol biosynthesis cysteine-adding enzyme BshC [Crocinitomicaceae bacterium]
MQKTTFSRIDSKAFSKFSNDFIYQPDIFRDLIHRVSKLEAFEQQITDKSSFPTEKRAALHQHLTEQYKAVDATENVEKNIALLRDSQTFTVTTGHQLNLLTGPIFFIYKILHTIRLAENLKQRFSDYNFVPVYWMASEDHDFEEINHTHLFNRKITWETQQSGPVGEFETENLESVLEEVKAFFANQPDAPLLNVLEKYTGKNLSEATFRLVHELFKDYGLVILDANSASLKREFVPVMLRETETQFAGQEVLKANEKLENLGYKPQIFARPVNLFYIGKGFRERIVFENGIFSTEHLGPLTLAEIKAKIEASPEQFSPNVVLRPLYQETILPNLAYIGGGAEIAYWTQLKGVFDAAEIVFPILQVRNSLHLVDKNSQKKLSKLGLRITDLFHDLNELKNRYVQENGETLDFSAIENKSAELQSSLNTLITAFDANLKSFAEAENTKISKQVEYIKAKIQKQQKSQFDGELKILEDLKNKLFPQNALQERHDNFISFCPDGNYESLIRGLYENVDPWEKDLIILEL